MLNSPLNPALLYFSLGKSPEGVPYLIGKVTDLLTRLFRTCTFHCSDRSICTPCWILLVMLGVVAQRLKPVKLLATFKQRGASTPSVVGSCWPIVGSLRLTHKSSSKFLVECKALVFMFSVAKWVEWARDRDGTMMGPTTGTGNEGGLWESLAGVWELELLVVTACMSTWSAAEVNWIKMADLLWSCRGDLAVVCDTGVKVLGARWERDKTM